MKNRLIYSTARWAGCLIILSLFGASRPAEAAGPGLHGRVLALDESGHYAGVVEGAQIEFKDEGGTVVAETTSAANGHYRVDLAPGVYTYKVEAEGYQIEDEGRGLELRHTSGYEVHDFPLGPDEAVEDDQPYEPEAVAVGELTGRVVEISENGERIGIPNARISLRLSDLPDLRTVRSRTSPADPDQEGAYQSRLPAGEWRAAVSADGFESLVDPDPIEIIEGSTRERDFVLQRKTQVLPTDSGIRGTVSVPQGVNRPDEIAVRIDSLTPGVVTSDEDPIIVDGDGQFERNLPSGKYRVIAKAEGFQPAIRPLVLVFPARFTHVDLQLLPLPTDGAVPETTKPETLIVKVSVWERAGRAMQPIEGARVMLRRDGQELKDAMVVATEANGIAEFDIPITDSGSYIALAQADGYSPGGAKLTVGPDEPNSASIELQKSAEETPEELVTATGYVAYRDEASPTGLFGIPGTRLDWRSSKSQEIVATFQSEAQGRFEVELPAETYTVQLTPPVGFRGDTAEVTVRLGMQPVTLVLERTERVEPLRPVQVTGYVVTSSLRAEGRYVGIAGADIHWTSRSGADVTVRTDLRGRFVATLFPDRYMAGVSASGYGGIEEAVTVEEGMEPVRFILERKPEREDGVRPLATLVVRVSERLEADRPRRVPMVVIPSTARPVSNAEVEIAAGSTDVDSGRTDARGLYSAQLEPGRYTLKVTHRGHEPAAQQVLLTPAGDSIDILLTPTAATLPPQHEHWVTVRVVEKVVKPVQDGNQRDPSQRRQRRNPPTQITQPVANATVKAYAGRNEVASEQTDQTGVARIKLPGGSYRLEVSRQGFEPAQQSVTIANDDVTRQIVLERRQYVE